MKNNLKAFYLGPEGTFSSIAAKSSIDSTQYQLTPCDSWISIWEQLELNRDSVSVVPVENSITSNVHANIDVLFEAKFRIIAEVLVNIKLGLFVKPGVKLSDITAVYSHPQALMQAKQLIASRSWEPHEALSTTHALEIVTDSTQRSISALAPLNSYNEHKLTCVLENAQDSNSNQTRFLVVSNTAGLLQPGNKASVLIETAHEVGSLSRVLQHFTAQNINMTKIESRPIPGKTWSYQFWIDLQLENTVTEAELRKNIMSSNAVESLVILGLYQPGNVV